MLYCTVIRVMIKLGHYWPQYFTLGWLVERASKKQNMQTLQAHTTTCGMYCTYYQHTLISIVCFPAELLRVTTIDKYTRFDHSSKWGGGPPTTAPNGVGDHRPPLQMGWETTDHRSKWGGGPPLRLKAYHGTTAYRAESVPTLPPGRTEDDQGETHT